jgi:AraC-like DNA-binding protein
MLPELTVGDWENLRRELIWIRRARVEARHRDLPYGPKGVVAAWRLIRGRVDFVLPKETVSAKAGQWIFPGGGRGRRTFSADAEFVSIRFRTHWAGGQDLFDHRAPLVAGAASARPLDEAGFALVDFVQDNLVSEGQLLPQAGADLTQYLELRSHFDRWFEAYARFMTAAGRKVNFPQPLDERIAGAVRAMEGHVAAGDNPREPELARLSGLSLSHFKRLFVRDLGLTPKEWLNRKRLEAARVRLRETTAPVKRIGYELGFRSPNHFSSWFRRQTGRTPGRFRREAAQNFRREAGAA